MKRIRISLLLLPLLWVALFHGSAEAASNALPHRAFPPSWQAALDKLTASNAIPGAVAILKSPEWGVRVGVTGYGNLSTKEKMSPNLSFRVGSVTKVFTAQMILMLEQQGRIKLTDPILRYLGDNPAVAAIPNIGKVTIADCLQMKSGITNYLANPTIGRSPEVDPGRQFTPTELLRVLSPGIPNPLKPDFAPGDEYPNPYWVAVMGPKVQAPPEFPPYPWWTYSNSNYILLGLVVQKVSGAPLEETVQSLICGRLGLSDTLLAVDLKLPRKMMRGYTRLDALRNPKYSDWRDVTGVNPSSAWAAGAIVSTPWDLLKFVESIFKTGKLLNQGTQRKWLTFVSADIHWANVEYGMGLMQSHRPYGDFRGHGGAYPGYKTVMYHFPDSDTSLIIAANTWDGQSEVDLMDAIMTLVTSAPTEPRPAQGRISNLGRNNGLTLAWQPGRVYGDTYTVFWGTRPDLVEAATEESHPGVKMMTTTGLPRAGIAGLAPEETYFWRVETVSTQSGRIRGPLWRFRTAGRSR
jgi:D-alanyl-D-alanine carboxypeptidase